jgi:chromosome segregation ATPase
MKKTILKLTVTGIMLASGFTSFSQENKKAEKERKNVAEAQKDLGEAKADSAADFQAFKKDAEEKISSNKTKIAELKAKKSTENKETKAKYDKKVLALEKKNNELNSKIEQCGNTKTSKWASFKREFTHDMDELGHAFKDIGVDNTK